MVSTTNAATTVSAVVIRADGTRVDLGVICSSKPTKKVKKLGGKK